MKTSIPFGKERLKIDIPQKNLLDIITSTSNPICGNEHNIILNSLNNPVSSKRLFEIAKEEGIVQIKIIKPKDDSGRLI